MLLYQYSVNILHSYLVLLLDIDDGGIMLLKIS